MKEETLEEQIKEKVETKGKSRKKSYKWIIILVCILFIPILLVCAWARAPLGGQDFNCSFSAK